MSMEDILKVLVDSRRQGGAAQQGNDAMSELVGGLLGGAQSQQQGGLGDMMGLLETVMGGQGDSGTSSGNDPIMALLTPFVGPLAKKVNIPTETAMVIVSFVVHKLLAHHPTSGRDSNSFDLDEMLKQLNTGRVDSGLLQSSGMVKELSRKTGLDEATTEQSLQLALSLVGKTVGGMSGAGNAAKSVGLSEGSTGKAQALKSRNVKGGAKMKIKRME